MAHEGRLWDGRVATIEDQAKGPILNRGEMTMPDSKVPGLRNIALTAPYFHDGSQNTLSDAVRQMGWLQLGRKFTDPETAEIVAFLASLSDMPRAGKAVAAK